MAYAFFTNNYNFLDRSMSYLCQPYQVIVTLHFVAQLWAQTTLHTFPPIKEWNFGHPSWKKLDYLHLKDFHKYECNTIHI